MEFKLSNTRDLSDAFFVFKAAMLTAGQYAQKFLLGPNKILGFKRYKTVPFARIVINGSKFPRYKWYC